MRNKLGFVPVVALLIIAVAVVVGVGASIYLVLQTRTSIIQEVVQQTPPQSPTVDTSGWQTYRNEKYGFEFKYPKEWSTPRESMYSTRVGIEFDSKLSIESGILFNQSLNRPHTFEEVVRNFPGDKIELTLAGKRAVKIGDSIYAIQESENGFTLFQRQGGTNLETFEGIVSTFRFIGLSINTSAWQTYRSERYGFEFRYPANYRIESNNETISPCLNIVGVAGAIDRGFLPGFDVAKVGTFSSDLWTYECTTSSDPGVLHASTLMDLIRKVNLFRNQKIEDKYNFNGYYSVKVNPFKPQYGPGFGGPEGPTSIFLFHNNFIYEVRFNAEYSTISQIANTFKFLPPPKVDGGDCC